MNAPGIQADAAFAGLLPRLDGALGELDPQTTPAHALARLLAAGLDTLPLPGHGQTLLRWQALARVAAFDLSLAKLYEGHIDALAILHELKAEPFPDTRCAWGVWAAEPPGARVTLHERPDGTLRLSGLKCWCSGAASGSHALLTAWPEGDRAGHGPQLVAVALRQPGVSVSAQAWQAVGMAGSASLDVSFDAVLAVRVGQPGDYLSRPGFWHGGAGIAACWYGGAQAVARALYTQLSSPNASRDALRLAALGKVDVALQATAALLRQAAASIDAQPQVQARALALRVRQSAEACARQVLDEVGRTLGAGPFCRDAHFARLAADLPVFIRQSHAERDLAALGENLLTPATEPWSL